MNLLTEDVNLLQFEKDWLRGAGVDDTQLESVPASTFHHLYKDLLQYGPNHEVILGQAQMLSVQLNNNALAMQTVAVVEALIDDPAWMSLEHAYYYNEKHVGRGTEQAQAVNRVIASIRKLGQDTWYLSPFQRHAGSVMECYPLSVSFFGLLGPGVLPAGTALDDLRIQTESIIFDAFAKIRLLV